MPLPILPTPPSRDDPANFSTRADAFLGALPEWTDAANALEQSLQLVATTGTSTTSLAIGTGSKTLATQAGKAWVVGSYLYLVSAASIANRMVGQVTAYDSGTGVLTVNVSATVGAGTLASWVIGLATSTANASDVAVDDPAGLFLASSVETVLAEIFSSVRSGSWLSADAGGTANAITATFSPTITSIAHRQVVYVRASLENTGAATFQADATTAKSIYKGANKALLPGDIAGAGHLLALRRDATLDKYELLNPARGIGDSDAPGTVKMFAGETPPAGWMECDGSSLVQASYPDLYNSIGTRHGSADAAHFNLPDYRGRFPRGWNHGASNDADAASRTASNTGGATGDHVGTLQGDAIRNITGTLGFVSGGGLSGTGAFSVPSGYGNQISAGVVGSQPYGANFNASGSVPTGSDNRPSNVSTMFIIKY